MENTSVLRVTGRGRVRLRPDTIRINADLTGVYKDYAETLKRSAEDTEAMREAMIKLGFAGEDLKTVGFGVDARYEGYNDKNGNYRERFKGFEYNHSLKLEFASDNELLGKVLYALGTLPSSPRFSITYTVKDTEAAKNALIANAVADAKAKAETLAAAAGVALKSVASIDYSMNSGAFEVRPVSRMMKYSMADEAANDCCGYDINIEADDIVEEDAVTVVWNIESR